MASFYPSKSYNCNYCVLPSWFQTNVNTYSLKLCLILFYGTLLCFYMRMEAEVESLFPQLQHPNILTPRRSIIRRRKFKGCERARNNQVNLLCCNILLKVCRFCDINVAEMSFSKIWKNCWEFSHAILMSMPLLYKHLHWEAAKTCILTTQIWFGHHLEKGSYAGRLLHKNDQHYKQKFQLQGLLG